MMLPSTGSRGQKSRIVPMLDDMAVVVPRGDAHYVVTEFGAVNLFGKNLQERAVAVISIAHPDFREALFEEARAAARVQASRLADEYPEANRGQIVLVQAFKGGPRGRGSGAQRLHGGGEPEDQQVGSGVDRQNFVKSATRSLGDSCDLLQQFGRMLLNYVGERMSDG